MGAHTYSKLLSCQFLSRLPFRVDFSSVMLPISLRFVIETQLITYFADGCLHRHLYGNIFIAAITSDNFLVNSTRLLLVDFLFARFLCSWAVVILSLMMFAWHFLFVIQFFFSVIVKMHSDKMPTLAKKDAICSICWYFLQKYFNLLVSQLAKEPNTVYLWNVWWMFSLEWHFYLIKSKKFVTRTKTN